MRTALFLAAALFAAAGDGAAGAASETVAAKGHWLAGQLDAMDVETKWIAGQPVDWRTGLPRDASPARPGRHTHCSAFVAAAAARLGVYILRPPQHSSALLANAQHEWLETDGAAEGWRPLPDGATAQAAANRGELVVASYLSHRADTPGHIAIVRPAPRSAAEIAAEGPLVIQAGTINSAAISLRAGFAGHPAAWRNDEVRFYGHQVALPGEAP